MAHHETITTPASNFDSDRFAWVIGPVFMMLAVGFLVSGLQADVPIPPATKVSLDRISPGARREAATTPEIENGGYLHNCVECHRVFDSRKQQSEKRVQHLDIVLRHGMNDNCLNCHDRTERDKLGLSSGEKLTFEQVPRLCAQCHGTVYRDWQRGTHGKTMGSWDSNSGKQTRLNCNDCHDPHSPAYPGIVPLPPPNTLRMGVQSLDAHREHGKHVPIQEGAERAAGSKHSDTDHTDSDHLVPEDHK